MAKLSRWLNLLFKIVLVDIMITGVVLAWSWIAPDFSVVSLSNRFCLCGIAAIILCVVSVYGDKSVLGNFSMTYAQSVSEMNMAERTSLMMKDLYRGYGFAITMFLSGSLAILAAVLIA